MDPSPAALAIEGLTKTYDDGTPALRSLDLEVEAGRFFGLLGPNGAGKTTLINAVCNLIRLDSGSIRVFGLEHTTLDARRLVGVAEQDPNLDRFLSVREALVYHGGYFGMGRRFLPPADPGPRAPARAAPGDPRRAHRRRGL